MRVGYLSGAPRVSTRLEARTSGPRAHILGVVNAFQRLGWGVETFIVGDRLPAKVAKNFTTKVPKSGFILLFIDLARVVMSLVNSRKALKELGIKVDVVYERFSALQCLGWIFKKHSIPWILETNGPFYYEAKTERRSLVLSGIAKRMEVRAIERCDLLVCVSESLKKIIVRETGVSEQKVIVVPNAVDTCLLDPRKFSSHRVFEGFTVGYVGCLINWQALDLLMNAIHRLQQERGIKIHLVIVGDGPMRQEWEGLSRSLGIDDQIYFAGHVDYREIPNYIAGFDIGYSGQIPLGIGDMYMSPLKLYEYMAMERPVLASEFEDAKRLVQNNKTGFLFAPNDSEDLQSALVKCYEQRSSLNEMGKLARLEVVNYHSWEVRVQKLIEKMDRILEERHEAKNCTVIRCKV